MCQGHAQTTLINAFATDSTPYFQGILLPPAGCCVLSSGTPWCRLWRTMGRLCNSQKHPSLCGGQWVPCVVVVWAELVVLTYLPQHHTRIRTGLIHHSFQVSQVALEPTSQCNRCRFDPWVEEDPLEESTATHSRILAWRIPWTEEPGGLIVHRAAKSWPQLKQLGTRAPKFSGRNFSQGSIPGGGAKPTGESWRLTLSCLRGSLPYSRIALAEGTDHCAGSALATS